MKITLLITFLLAVSFSSYAADGIQQLVKKSSCHLEVTKPIIINAGENYAFVEGTILKISNTVETASRRINIGRTFLIDYTVAHLIKTEDEVVESIGVYEDNNFNKPIANPSMDQIINSSSNTLKLVCQDYPIIDV